MVEAKTGFEVWMWSFEMDSRFYRLSVNYVVLAHLTMIIIAGRQQCTRIRSQRVVPF